MGHDPQGITPWQLRRALRALRGGGLIAYPTEAVWGLGCDPANPHALQRLLQVKQRPWEKGLILIASHWEHLSPWLAIDQPPPAAATHWPGHVTMLLPAAPEVSVLLRGRHDTLACRITPHPLVQRLCDAFGGAIVSTSANLSKHPTARSLLQCRRQLGEQIDCFVNGPLGQAGRASRIIDPYTGQTYRT